MFQIPFWHSVLPSSTAWMITQSENLWKMGKGLAKSGKEAMDNPDFQAGFSGAAPPMIKPWVEERFSKDGYFMKYDDRNNPLKAYERNDFDWTLRKFGFRSTEEAKKLERDYDLTGDKLTAYNDKQEILKEMRRRVTRGDTNSDEMRELMHKFFAAGGTTQEYINARKDWFRPETVEEKYDGKPSFKRGEYLNFLRKLREKRPEDE